MNSIPSHARRPRWRARAATIAAFRTGDWLVLGEAIATVLVVQAALHVAAFPRVLAWATHTGRMPAAAWTAARVERVAWLVSLGGRVMRLRCLTRSLALARVLGRRGIVTDVRIGVRTEDGALKAHAWVEWEGRALNDSAGALQPFTPLDRLGDVLNV